MALYSSLPLIVTARAKESLLAQRDWYNNREDGLGDKFYTEIMDALVYLEANYKTPPHVQGRKDIQRYLTRGPSFRWLIYFQVKGDKIVVPSIVHPSRRPLY